MRNTIMAAVMAGGVMLACASNAMAWGYQSGTYQTCAGMGTPGFSGHTGWNLFLTSPNVCSWSKTVNDTRMGGFPGQYFCSMTANLYRIRGRGCQGRLYIFFSGTGIWHGKQACTDLFSWRAVNTVYMGAPTVCNGQH